MTDSEHHELHAHEWEMLADQRAHIDLIRAIIGSTPTMRKTCQYGHVHGELYEPDMRYVPASAN